MNLVRKMRTFLSFDTKTMILMSEALFFLGMARLQKKRPLSKIAPTLGKWSGETSHISKVSNRLVLKRIFLCNTNNEQIYRLGKPMPCAGNCS